MNNALLLTVSRGLSAIARPLTVYFLSINNQAIADNYSQFLVICASLLPFFQEHTWRRAYNRQANGRRTNIQMNSYIAALFITSFFIIWPALSYMNFVLLLAFKLIFLILIFVVCDKIYEDIQRYYIYSGKLFHYSMVLIFRFWAPIVALCYSLISFPKADFEYVIYIMLFPHFLFFILVIFKINLFGSLAKLKSIFASSKGRHVVLNLILNSIKFHIWSIIFGQLLLIDRLYQYQSENLTRVYLNYNFAMVVTLLFNTIYFTAIRKSIVEKKIEIKKACFSRESLLTLSIITLCTFILILIFGNQQFINNQFHGCQFICSFKFYGV